MKVKKIPLRMCTGCMEMKPLNEGLEKMADMLSMIQY